MLVGRVDRVAVKAESHHDRLAFEFFLEQRNDMAIHKAKTAPPMQMPRMRAGKISDSSNQVTGDSAPC